MQNSHGYQRRKHYKDHQIQRLMIIGLISVEMLLTIGALVFLYLGFSTAIDEHLYRIHVHSSEESQSIFLTLLFKVIIGLVLINGLALFLADRIWIKYVRWVVDIFRTNVSAIAQLDFSSVRLHSKAHSLIDLTEQWCQAERTIWQEIKCQAQNIEAVASNAPNSNPEETKKHIEKLADYLSHLKR